MYRLNPKQLGQSGTEFIIIVALLAIAAIAIYGLFGDTARSELGVTSEELSGPQAAAVGAPDTSNTATKGLGDFSEGAR